MDDQRSDLLQRLKYPPHLRNRLVGAEIELSRAPREMHDVVRTNNISVCEDGSLDKYRGTELVTPPADWPRFVSMITELGDSMHVHGAEADETCGLHIHVGVSDMTVHELYRVLLLYTTLEPYLYGLCDKERYTSHFCKPWGYSLVGALSAPNIKEFRKAIDELVYETFDYKALGTGRRVRGRKNRYGAKSEKYVHQRYYGLNIHSYWYRGTLEFRMHEGTASGPEILFWAEVCLSLVEAASRMTVNAIKELDTKSINSATSIPGFRPELLQEAIKRIIQNGVKRCAE